MRHLAQLEIKAVQLGVGKLLRGVDEPHAAAAGDIGDGGGFGEQWEDGRMNGVAEGGRPEVVLEIEARGGGVGAVAVEDVAVAVCQLPVC